MVDGILEYVFSLRVQKETPSPSSVLGSEVVCSWPLIHLDAGRAPASAWLHGLSGWLRPKC